MQSAEMVVNTPWGPEAGRFKFLWRQETRTVIDRTLGGDVVYYSGRRPANLWHTVHQKVCSLEQWQVWVDQAKRMY